MGVETGGCATRELEVLPTTWSCMVLMAKTRQVSQEALRKHCEKETHPALVCRGIMALVWVRRGSTGPSEKPRQSSGIKR